MISWLGEAVTSRLGNRACAALWGRCRWRGASILWCSCFSGRFLVRLFLKWLCGMAVVVGNWRNCNDRYCGARRDFVGKRPLKLKNAQ